MSNEVTVSDVAAKRLAAIEAIAKEYSPTDNTCGQEDLDLMRENPNTIEQFALVSIAGEYRYITTAGSLRLAESRAENNAGDDVWAESPIKIVDLDSGQQYEPRITWRLKTKNGMPKDGDSDGPDMCTCVVQQGGSTYELYGHYMDADEVQEYIESCEEATYSVAVAGQFEVHTREDGSEWVTMADATELVDNVLKTIGALCDPF